MKSRANGLERRVGAADGELEDEAAVLRVSEIIQYGTGGGSRMDLTVEASGRQVRLTRLRARDTVSYRKVRQMAIEQRAALPYVRDGDELWSVAFCAAMEHARFEPFLEGEDVAVSIATEILALLQGGDRGRDAVDLKAGKVIVRRDHQQKPRLVMSPGIVVEHVRRRLVDDVLPRATIAEAAVSLLGMRKVRPHFSDGRPWAWSFPLPLPATRELDEPEVTSTSAQGSESLDADGRVGSNGSTSGSARGPLVEKPISHTDNEMRSGSNGSPKYATAPAAVHRRRAESAISSVADESADGSDGPYLFEPTPVSGHERSGRLDSSRIPRTTETRPATKRPPAPKGVKA